MSCSSLLLLDGGTFNSGDAQQGYSTPPEAVGIPTQRKHTILTNILDKAVQELVEKSGPRLSSSKNQGGGDREPTPAPQHLHQGELNLATERWFLEPNKVRFMDEPDTYRANVGRHREQQPRLVRAKTYPHLIFTDPKKSFWSVPSFSWPNPSWV